MPPLLQLASSVLQPAATDEELALHLAALEWSLADPIVIESTADVKSRDKWQERIQPYHHQMQNLMTFCRRLPVTLIADDVGLGKTISAGLILSELMTRRRVTRTLVLCPSILGPQWVEEMETKFGVFGRFVKGTDLRAELRDGQSPLVVTTYESGSRYLDSVDSGSFDMLILDEAHKLRNLHGTQNPPKLAQRIHQALTQRIFKYVLMLTATPIQNRLWDLYTLVDCLAAAKGHANPFGTPLDFQRRYIVDPQSARILRPESKAEFRSILRQYLVRTRREEVRLLFPKREVRLMQVAATEQEAAMMRLVAEHIEELNGFQQSSVLQAMMSSPAALVSQLDNMAAKTPSMGRLAAELRALGLTKIQPAKLQGLIQVVEQMRREKPDWRLVIFTIRKETQRIIGEALDKRGIAVGYIQGGEPQANRQTVKSYTETPPTINVIVSTDAGAEGVNLQAGNWVINFDLPWNPMIVEQRIGRVQRLASKFGHVIITNLAVEGSPESRVVVRLMQKLQVISDTVGDIEAVLEGADDGDEDGSSFETRIRDLVLKALIGQDVNRATELQVQSIQRAKELFEQQRHEIDQTVGELSELHHTGPAMPKLASVQPAIPFREFVERGLALEGATIERKGPQVLLAHRERQPIEEVVFDEAMWQVLRRPGAFGGRGPKLYVPGKPAFERLVERWVIRSSHRISDNSQGRQARLKAIAEQLIAKIPDSSLKEIEVHRSTEAFQGTITCRVTTANAVDSYEKLLAIPSLPDGHQAIPNEYLEQATWYREETRPELVVPGLSHSIGQAVANDDDVRHFAEFYQARLKDELSKGGNQPHLLKKITSDLQPTVHGEVVGLGGSQYEVCNTSVRFTIDDCGDYKLTLDVIPANGQVLTSITWNQCAESRRRVPETCLERCELTGMLVLSHLLTASDVSGRRVLRTQLKTCQITGKLAAADEFGQSDLSHKSAVVSAFIVSPISGRRALPEELERCEFTGLSLPADELRISQVSGKRFRIDEETRSAVSHVCGHTSEFARCNYTADAILPTEGIKSDVDGRLVRIDCSIRSELPPFRVSSPDHVIKCAMSGKTIFTDEAAKCVVTGELIAREYLAASEESGQLARKDALVSCSHTGKRLLPEECVISDLNGQPIASSVAIRSPVSGRRCVAAEAVRCEFTQARVLPDELGLSDLSQKYSRVDQIVSSEFSGRRGHINESIQCEYSRKRLLKDEAGKSAVSGKVTAASTLVPSEKTGRLVVLGELVRCELTGKQLAIDEIAVSAVTGRRGDKALMVPSAQSGRLAFPKEMITCAESGRRLLPNECQPCAASGRVVDRNLLVKSQASAALGLPSQMATCAFSKARVIPSELERCQATGQDVLPRYIERCTASNMRVRRDQLTQSVVSGRLVLPKFAVRSLVDGSICCRDEAVYCYWQEGPALPGQTAKCIRTGVTFCRDLINDRGEFRVLAEVMSGKGILLDFGAYLLNLRKRPDRKLVSASRAWGTASPRGGSLVICVELSEYLGLRVRYAALIYNVAKSEILGNITVATKSSRGWDVL